MEMKSYVISGVLMITMLVVGFFGGSYYNAWLNQRAELAESEQTLIIGTTKNPRWLDPVSISASFELTIGLQIFETLLRHNPVTGKIEPGLAAEMPNSTDGIVYTFKLRQGIEFHDGEELTADAVKFSWERCWNTTRFTISMTAKNWISTVEAVDKYTLRVTLRQPFGPIDSIFALCYLPIFSPVHYQGYEKDEYVGTGPFKFVQWLRDEEIVLERNDDYWRKDEVPKISKLIFKIYASSTSLSLAVRQGRIDVAWKSVPLSELDALSNDTNYVVMAEPASRVDGIFLNEKAAPLNDTRVRQAIAWCIDPDEVVEKAFLGIGANVIYSLMPENMLGYVPSFEKYSPRNVTKAKELLAEAGYADGFSMQYWTSSSYYGEERKAMATVLQTQLGEAGITIEVKDQEWGAFSTDRSKGNLPMCSIGITYTYFDSHFFLFNFMAGSGGPWSGHRWATWANYSNPTANQLLVQVEATTNETQRLDIYRQLQELAAETVPILTFCAPLDFAIINKNVNGFTISAPWFATSFYNVTKTLS